MFNKRKIRVLVVDDTIVYRKSVSDIMEELPEVELVGVAHNGKIAMAKIATLKPDLLTLDIEMPEMNGLEVLRELQKQHLGIGAIMLSTLTADGSEMTMRALELGAFDFILKPQSRSLAEGKSEIKRLIQPMIQAFARSKIASSLLGRKEPFVQQQRSVIRKAGPGAAPGTGSTTLQKSATARPALPPPAEENRRLLQ